MARFRFVSIPSGAQFPRINFVGNSSSCINMGAFEGLCCQVSLLTLSLGGVLPSEPVRSVLPSLRLAVACNAGRITMQGALDLPYPETLSDEIVQRNAP